MVEASRGDFGLAQEHKATITDDKASAAEKNFFFTSPQTLVFKKYSVVRGWRLEKKV